MRAFRVLAMCGALALVSVAGAPWAAAGGAVWSFDRDSYLPGETAIAATGVAWEHNPSLGTPEDGPYFAYVLPRSDGDDEIAPWPQIPSSAIEVGQVQVGLDGVEVSPGVLDGPHHVWVEFIVPDLAPGTYELLHCNRPCTKTLGDITWGVFVVNEERQAPLSCRSNAGQSGPLTWR